MPFSQYIYRVLLGLGLIVLATGSVKAGSLFGTVMEIHDGDTVTILCLKRPLKVRLMAIDAPEKEQPYAETARKHLSDLILNKPVVVEYSALGETTLIVGRVFMEETDVGAQMIRDGVAWYHRIHDAMLTEDQREVYAASELAARTEHRGIWQDPGSVPPWEFKDAQPPADPPLSKSPGNKTP